MGSAARAIGLQPTRGDAASALMRFCRELRNLTALHRNAGAFYNGWMRILAQFSGAGYSPGDGAPLPALVHPGLRVSVEA
jgi:hypothetical protein